MMFALVGHEGLSVTDNDGFYRRLVMILVQLEGKSGTLFTESSVIYY